MLPKASGNDKGNVINLCMLFVISKQGQRATGFSWAVKAQLCVKTKCPFSRHNARGAERSRWEQELQRCCEVQVQPLLCPPKALPDFSKLPSISALTRASCEAHTQARWRQMQLLSCYKHSNILRLAILPSTENLPPSSLCPILNARIFYFKPF